MDILLFLLIAIWGITILVKNELKFTKSRGVRGLTARLLAICCFLPFPLGLLSVTVGPATGVEHESLYLYYYVGILAPLIIMIILGAILSRDLPPEQLAHGPQGFEVVQNADATPAQPVAPDSAGTAEQVTERQSS